MAISTASDLQHPSPCLIITLGQRDELESVRSRRSRAPIREIETYVVALVARYAKTMGIRVWLQTVCSQY